MRQHRARRALDSQTATRFARVLRTALGAMKLYRLLSLTLAVCLAVAAPLHVMLLMSDSPTYRMWVSLQMALLVFGAVLFWLAARGRTIALIGAVVVSIPAIYINVVYINYGVGVLGWITPSVVLIAVCVLAFGASSKSRSPTRTL